MMKRKLILLIFLCMSTSLMAESNSSLSLTSTDIKHLEQLPVDFTCQGADINPGLIIESIPAETQSLALIVQNLNAPEGVWTHWVAYNIPPTSVNILKNTPLPNQLLNDFGDYSYHGPCPVDDKELTFEFRLVALRKKIVDINEGATVKDLEKLMRPYIIQTAVLQTKYRKQ